MSKTNAWPARIAFSALAILCLVPLIALALMGSAELGFGAVTSLMSERFVQRAIWFTLYQASLSTIISIGLALPVVLALRSAKQTPWLSALRVLFALPLVLPQIVAALAIVGVYGQNGWLARLLAESNLAWPSIYGLSGILLAHVFFNLPLAVRVFDQALNAMPSEYYKTAAQLGFSKWQMFRLVEWQILKRSLRGTAVLVFLLCATSFTIVLMLGGGPRSTTLEVAIYQSLTFDFDLRRAVLLIVLQLAITGTIAFTLAPNDLVSAGSSGFGISSAQGALSNMVGKTGGGWIGPLMLCFALAFIAAPFSFLLLDGLVENPFNVWTRSSVLNAVTTSLVIGFFSAVAANGLALAMISAGAKSRFSVSLPVLALIFPPIVLSAGWFLTIRQFADPYLWAPVLVVAINAAMALPFVLRIIDQAYQTHVERYRNLEDQLDMFGLVRWRVSLFVSLRTPLVIGFAFAFALSLGDFGVVALFGSERLQTLPFMIYASFGSYRTNDAASLALLLTLLVFAALALAEVFSRRSSRLEHTA